MYHLVVWLFVLYATLLVRKHYYVCVLYVGSHYPLAALRSYGSPVDASSNDPSSAVYAMFQVDITFVEP